MFPVPTVQCQSTQITNNLFSHLSLAFIYAEASESCLQDSCSLKITELVTFTYADVYVFFSLCADVVLSAQCDLADAVHQLVTNHSLHGEDKAGRGGKNVTISVSQFTALAAGCVLYLSSPGLVCTAVRQGRWGEEADRFLHNITHQDHHEHRHVESELHQHHEHEHMDVHGLKALLQELQGHYEPSDNAVSIRLQQSTVVLFER